MLKYKLGIIGCGNMGEALLAGILSQGKIKEKEIIVYDQKEDRNLYMEKNYRLIAAKSIQEILKSSEYVLLAVKPQNIEELLKKVKEFIGNNKFISIIAGIPTYYIENKIEGKVPVIRVMPNTPALVNKGVFAISKGKYATRKELNFTVSLLSGMGEIVEIEEKFQNLVTALSGSGPAYFFLLCKCIIEAGIKSGIDPEIAKKLVIGTMEGSAEILKRKGGDISKLIDMVTSPGGTTEKALEIFYKAGFEKIVIDAIDSAFKRAGELENMLDN